MKVFIILMVIVMCIAIPVYLLLRRQNQRILENPFQKMFLTGHVPGPLPGGFYAGSVPNYRGSWKGKKFNQAAATGVNIFATSLDGTQTKEQYPFKTYVGQGLQDPDLQVLKLDYNLPENPLWLRPIVDEIVELEPSHYLGKMHLVLMGHTLTLAWFELGAPANQ